MYEKCVQKKLKRTGENTIKAETNNNGTHLSVIGKISEDPRQYFNKIFSNITNFSDFVEMEFKGNVLTETGVAAIDIGRFKNLTTLKVTQNRVQRMNGIIPPFKKLENLDLSSNLIGELHGELFVTLPSLKVFDIRDNCLLIIDEVFRESKSIQRVYFANNEIQETIEIGNSVMTNQALEELDLSYNKLTNFTFKNEFVRKIKFNNNNLKKVKFRPLMTSGWRATKVEILELQNNQLSEIEFPRVYQAEFTNLKMVNLSNNNLEKILNINNITTLEILDLSSNPIALHADDFQLFSELNVLFLSNTSISDKELVYIFENIKTIRKLHVDSNKNIKSLINLKSESLEEIDVSNCPLESIDLANIKNLKKVVAAGTSIDDKKLVTFDFDRLTQLEDLDISRNDITNLNVAILKQMKSLKTLNLGFNKISSIDENDMKVLASNLLNLTDVILTGNSNEICEQNDFSYLKAYPNIKVTCKNVSTENGMWEDVIENAVIKIAIVLGIFGFLGVIIFSIVYWRSRRSNGGETTGIRYVNQLAGVNFLTGEEDANAPRTN